MFTRTGSTLLAAAVMVAAAARCLAAAAPLAAAVPPAAAVPVAAAHDDAYIAHDPASQVWSIGNASIVFTLGFDATGVLVVQGLSNPSTGTALDVDRRSDATVTVGGDELTLSAASSKLMFTGAATEATATGVRLTLSFEHKTLHTVIRRVYACYSGSPTIEVWTRIEAPGGAAPAPITNVTGWKLTMPAAPVRWVNGLRGDNAADAEPNPDTFTQYTGVLDDGVETDIGATGRSTEAFEPIVFVDGESASFYGGVIWSGAWRLSMLRSGDRVTVAASFPGTVITLTPDRPIEFPHAFLGFTDQSASSQAAALREFVLGGIRRGRALQPLVTYNTWFAYGATITEAEVEEEIRQEAALGVEVFVLDAGWHAGAGAEGPADFSSGLGSWTADPDRFPSQLAGLSDEAHALGMKFGLWVEPERVALSTVGHDGLAREDWLATINGSYDSDGHTAQLCLGSAAARKWLFTKLVALIDTVKPDYLKWDNNFWINCNRAGHGHGADGGNFAHVMGLYTVLDELRQRYPNLIIENVSGGGNRLDYGMMAYTDAAWMDDLTFPSSHVRHNIEGLSSLFPPAYLLSFVIDNWEEPIDGPDLPSIFRSRGLGVLGLTWQYANLTTELSFAIAEQIARYKLVRDTVTQAAATLLDNQAPTDRDGWDVVQEMADDRRTAIIFAFKADDSDGQLTVRLQNPLPDATYDVTSVDSGALGATTGADLAKDGVDIVHAAGLGSRAHLIVLTAR